MYKIEVFVTFFNFLINVKIGIKLLTDGYPSWPEVTRNINCNYHEVNRCIEFLELEWACTNKIVGFWLLLKSRLRKENGVKEKTSMNVHWNIFKKRHLQGFTKKNLLGFLKFANFHYVKCSFCCFLALFIFLLLFVSFTPPHGVHTSIEAIAFIQMYIFFIKKPIFTGVYILFSDVSHIFISIKQKTQEKKQKLYYYESVWSV